MVYDDDGEPLGQLEYGAEEEGREISEDEEESRELTYEEIWDDSALIDAWNSAAAEYEALNGKSQSWKNLPVKKSPLWYNVPPDPEKIKARHAEASAPMGGTEADTEPLDFNTFVPVHDPSLGLPVPASQMGNGQMQAAFPTPVSRDEAFNRALNAMYWTGYWTAIYHSYSQAGAHAPNRVDEVEEAEEEDDGDLVSTQR